MFFHENPLVILTLFSQGHNQFQSIILFYRKDCNTGDEDGMTPTLWAAFEGKLEALSLLVGRGGDPNKCDHYGNAALHLASARGHFDCVDFLVKFGVNIFSLDIDMHTPKELAAMNDCSEILR